MPQATPPGTLRTASVEPDARLRKFRTRREAEQPFPESQARQLWPQREGVLPRVKRRNILEPTVFRQRGLGGLPCEAYGLWFFFSRC